MAIFIDQDKFHFNGYPVIEYNVTGFEDPDNIIMIKNFLKRYNFLATAKNNASSWSYWTIRDQDTPEVIARKVYGSSHLYWLVLALNDISNPLYDWPLDGVELNDFIIKKYQVIEDDLSITPGDGNDHHHYEADGNDDYPAGTEVDDIEPLTNKVSVSNFEYELLINEAKRKIKLIQPRYLGQILDEAYNIVSSKFIHKN